jgi:hypothetical protein
VFQHPGNPDFPAGWTMRRTDNYGLLGVAWPGLQPFVLGPNRVITLRYRPSLQVTDGSPEKIKQEAGQKISK